MSNSLIKNKSCYTYQ